MTAALYARFSTDKQKESSIEDQHRLGRKRCEAEGWGEPLTFADTETSGSTPVALRAGGKALLTAAMAGEFQYLVIEGLDRLSRDSVEAEQIVRRLEHRGIRIIGLADGYDSQSSGRKIHRSMRGIMNEIYLDDLRAKTHRGLSGQVARGFHAGGLSYGYRSIADGDAGHRLEVVEEQAAVVRQIFEWHAEGWGTKKIASRLNEMGVRTGRGGTWAASAIHGREDRGTGVLNNELYRGFYVWNRAKFVKDPDTGRRQRIDRPKTEWVRREEPALRIVSEELWQRAHRPKMHDGGARGKTFTTLFAGILRCAKCGGSVTAVNAERYGCSKAIERGNAVCTGITIKRDVLDRRLLAVVREELLSPAALALMHTRVEHWLREAKRAASGDTARQRRQELDAEIGRLVDAIASIGNSDALTTRLRQAEQQRAALTEPSGDVPASIKHAMARYRNWAMNLQEVLQGDIVRARAAIADLLGRVELEKTSEGIFAEFDEPAGRMLVAAAGGVYANGCGDVIFPRRRLLIASLSPRSATKAA